MVGPLLNRPSTDHGQWSKAGQIVGQQIRNALSRIPDSKLIIDASV
jgi:hypothetical protein